MKYVVFPYFTLYIYCELQFDEDNDEWDQYETGYYSVIRENIVNLKVALVGTH